MSVKHQRAFPCIVAVICRIRFIPRIMRESHFSQRLAMATRFGFHSGCSSYVSRVDLLGFYRSPHWLVKQNDYPRAWKASKGLRETPLQAARDFYQLHCQLQVETILLGKGDIVHEIENWTHNVNGRLFQQEARRTNFFQRFWQLFTIQRNRRACLAACVVMGAQFSPLAYFTIDSFSLEIDPTRPRNSARVGTFELFLILYTAIGGNVSELTVNFLLAGVLAMTVPQLQNSLGQTRLLGLFAALDAFAALLVWLFVPGTRTTVSLEEFNYIFGVPTRVHIRYQFQKVLPWAVKSWIPWFFSQYLPWVARWYLCCGAGMGEKEAVRDQLAPLEALYQWNSLPVVRTVHTPETWSCAFVIMTSLPAEILQLICGYTDDICGASLRSLALVNHAFYYAALPHIYGRVAIRFFDYTTLEHAVTEITETPRGKHYRAYTKRLDVLTLPETWGQIAFADTGLDPSHTPTSSFPIKQTWT
ncbi:hypothetical protein UA08_08100 [Talaromyces atroroseus]|uniref:Uncharacterized protein n=1 Tax=Talaromyces atroroseus TaxID=1441469 RepID=A0A225ACI8_TALAT|nr:hypothetical protein UA08_08100 [Talaromyces atroroseus]OKL56593.1 hypothetical protein UA08_08100 [Talaromyces atroroseus]